MIPGRSIRSARRNALAASRRADADEFARLTLDLAGLLDRVRDVEVVRAELLWEARTEPKQERRAP